MSSEPTSESAAVTPVAVPDALRGFALFVREDYEVSVQA